MSKPKFELAPIPPWDEIPTPHEEVDKLLLKLSDEQLTDLEHKARFTREYRVFAEGLYNGLPEDIGII
jgi:hypothetical protein